MRRLLPVFIFGLVAHLIGAAQAHDVSLDNVMATDKGVTVVFRHIQVLGTNLTPGEVSTLFSTGDEKKRAALFVKLDADSVDVPETRISFKHGSVTLHDWSAKNIQAGKVGSMQLAGADGSFDGPRRIPVTVAFGAFSAADVTLPGSAATVGGQGTQASAVTHFSWSGFRATAPDKSTPADAVGGNLWRVSLASLTGQGSYQGGAPSQSSAQMKHLVIQPPPSSQAGRAFGAFGYKQLDMGASFSGAYDPANQAYSVSDYTISGAGAGAVVLKALFGSISAAVFATPSPARNAALAKGVLKSLTVRVTNKGLFQKFLVWYAAQHSQSAKLLRRQWAAAATLLIPLMMKGDPDGPDVAEAITRFIESPSQLTVKVKAKGKGLPFTEVKPLIQSKTILSHLDLKATAGP
ncbi:MAG TPA: hypothetical protein VND97_07420 [Beijerinckiaceae bacterium]|nr:hypothetical protein [Beijerinckiaceae bacterium]